MIEQQTAQAARCRYWFPAKSYGWGWGWPSAWQGWLVLGLFALLQGLGILWFAPARAALAYPLYVAALVAALLAACCLKGEPPRWSWGKK
ncbi:hypothetical protein ACFDR9_004111 [Janthinobacterium sp. CG_23.3]|uniref:hypothetical protein n=1 Tax=unclassified Janthinobacterium TaxID=2610881 RepID=UPI0003452C8A|nr:MULTISPECIES: hypothetical protein [unclassified Janthinobacterium]MEC5160867.1 hypothetical protein [Janthinobacterium sp. CG_S6]